MTKHSEFVLVSRPSAEIAHYMPRVAAISRNKRTAKKHSEYIKNNLCAFADRYKEMVGENDAVKMLRLLESVVYVDGRIAVLLRGPVIASFMNELSVDFCDYSCVFHYSTSGTYRRVSEAMDLRKKPSEIYPFDVLISSEHIFGFDFIHGDDLPIFMKNVMDNETRIPELNLDEKLESWVFENTTGYFSIRSAGNDFDSDVFISFADETDAALCRLAWGE